LHIPDTESTAVQISFKVQPVADINWNIIDHIILGYVDKVRGTRALPLLPSRESVSAK
jgi:hypothetical protein